MTETPEDGRTPASALVWKARPSLNRTGGRGLMSCKIRRRRGIRPG